jgi:dTDP-L-rhamnose 4-epimerase
MTSTVLLTGGAGFIGSHVAELLLEKGYNVRVYDKLVEQVHQGAGPRYVPVGAEFVEGDVSDREGLKAALGGVDGVLHLAAEVGVGQSMYEIDRYVQANTGGTGVLLDILANESHQVGKIVVASSMSIYGEGLYECPEHGEMAPNLRGEAQLAEHVWELRCPTCGLELKGIATRESKPPRPTSVYAISKMDQELLCLSYGAAYDTDVVALRYFNTYGPRQALSNPYTGVAAIFSGRLLNGRAPLVFEDGLQKRDLIHVHDVARATVLALETKKASGHAINVGVGQPMTIVEVGRILAEQLNLDVEPEVTGQYRSGDIRHCWADTTMARELLGFTPEIAFSHGMAELVDWLSSQTAEDRVDEMRLELEKRGLAR